MCGDRESPEVPEQVGLKGKCAWVRLTTYTKDSESQRSGRVVLGEGVQGREAGTVLRTAVEGWR